MDERPPIVLVFADQLRGDALGPHTPRLSALARESARFETCLTNAPLCRPARFTLMTGQPVHVHGVSTNARPPSGRGRPSHVRRLRDEAGYHTAVIGKTHLHGGQGHLDAHRPRLRDWGFEDALELPDAQQHWVRSAHSDWLSQRTAPGEPDKALRQQDYVLRYSWSAPPPEAEPWGLQLEDHLDLFCAREAAAYLRRYARPAPLYLQVCFPGPHPPFDAPQAWSDRIDLAQIPPPLRGPEEGPISPARERYARQQRLRPEDWTEPLARALQARYLAKVALVDEAVGQVLDALRERDLYDRCWLLVTADHGELLGDHGLMGKVLCYESALRVPLLVRPPGGVTGWVDRGTVDLLDVVDTILEAAGLAGEGRGLTRRATEGAAGPRAHHDKPVLFENMGYAGLRAGELTLGWQLDLGCPVELFDRSDDPGQLRNRVEEPSHRGQLARMVTSLRELRGGLGVR